jgi:fimbrial isopeptide formation D2 family protein
MKKFLTVIMAVVMIFAMAIPAFATNITINGESGRDYNGYRLLDLTTSLKVENCHTDGNHTDACYNYSYTVNNKYREILQQEVFDNATNVFWQSAGKPDAASKVTDQQILDYLVDKTSDANGIFGSLRDVADRIYVAIKADEEITADVTSTQVGTFEDVDQGYWMFADVTNLAGSNDKANSLVMVDTAGQQNVVITPKTDLPTVEKKVKDITDSTDANINDNDWQDSADHDINDVVPFKLTATLPNNVTNYDDYKIVFHDSMSAGLTLDEDSVKVYMYASKEAAEADVELDNYSKDVTGSFAVETAEDKLLEGETFTVTCTDVLAIDGVDKNTVFVVYYEATLNGNAVIGAGGNPNEVYLEYSNNPYGDGTGKTREDKVIVFTYKVVINKVDEAKAPLKGAGFTLHKKDATGAYVQIGEELKGDNMVTFTWTGLDDGNYKLVESTVPDGYNKMDDVEFVITAEHDEEDDNPALTGLNGGTLGTGEVSTGAITKDVENKTGTILPETGAMGTFLFICGGATLVLVAAVFMITRKKMSVFED